MKFALFIQAKEVKSTWGQVITPDGAWFRLDESQDLPAWATSIEPAPTPERAAVPTDTKLFDTRKAAEDFFARWGGHGWQVQPNGEFCVLEVRAVHKQVLDHYEIVRR
jgi:hypothetical protein